MGYNLAELVRLRDWARAGGDEEWKFHLGWWINIGPPLVSRGPGVRTACLAGGIVLMHGAVPVWEAREGISGMRCLEVRYRKVLHAVPELAADILGLESCEADLLFDPEPSLFESPRDTALSFLDDLIVRAEQGLDNLEARDVEDWVNDNADIRESEEEWDSDAYYGR